MNSNTKQLSIVPATREASAFAEVIESYPEWYTAYCWQWNQVPHLGSLVTVPTDTGTIYGIVATISVGTNDPSRIPFAYQKTEAELLSQHPEVFELLKTSFGVIVVGYSNKTSNAFQYLLPPTPNKIHAFVYQATTEEHEAFFASSDYLNILFAFAHRLANLDELLLAILRNLAGLEILSANMLEQFCETFTLLTGNEYRRLKLFLRRIEHIQKHN